MGAMASQITSLTIVCLTVYSGADQRKHQSSLSLSFVWGIHRWSVNSPRKGPVTRKMFPFDNSIMCLSNCSPVCLLKSPVCFASDNYFQVELIIVAYVLLISGWNSLHNLFCLYCADFSSTSNLLKHCDLLIYSHRMTTTNVPCAYNIINIPNPRFLDRNRMVVILNNYTTTMKCCCMDF